MQEEERGYRNKNILKVKKHLVCFVVVKKILNCIISSLMIKLKRVQSLDLWIAEVIKPLTKRCQSVGVFVRSVIVNCTEDYVTHYHSAMTSEKLAT